MMKRWIVALFAILIFVAAPLMAADILTSGVCAAGTTSSAGCAVVTVSGNGTVGLQVTGTFVGTLSFEQTNDDLTWVAMTVYAEPAKTAVTSTTGAGLFTAPVAGIKRVRVRFSAFTSGTATVYAIKTEARMPTPGGASGDPFDLAADHTFTGTNTFSGHPVTVESLVSASGSALQIGPGGTSGNSVTLTNGATLSGALLIEGNGNTVAADGVIALVQMFLRGASIAVSYTNTDTTPDTTLIGEHITVTDDNARQGYGLGLNGGGPGDLVVHGGQYWTAIGSTAVDKGDDWFTVGNAITADYLQRGYLFGRTLDVNNDANSRTDAFLVGRTSTITNATNAIGIGADLLIKDLTGDPIGGFAVGGGSTIDGDDSFDTLFTFGYGHTLTATANQQMLIGFDGTTLPASEAVGVGVSPTPELVLTAGFASVTAALKVTMQTPATAGADCTKDTFAFDTGFLYVCTATNTWKRVAIATW